MKTEVLLERLPDAHYRVTGGGRFAISADGSNREDALNNFREAVVALVPKDAEIVQIDILTSPNGDSDTRSVDPLAQFAGIALGNPLYSLFLEQIQRNREAEEAEENRKSAAEASGTRRESRAA